jgi:hypothetical protein
MLLRSKANRKPTNGPEYRGRLPQETQRVTSLSVISGYCGPHFRMSALPPKADINDGRRDVRWPSVSSAAAGVVTR